jgi:hypothetical protein
MGHSGTTQLQALGPGDGSGREVQTPCWKPWELLPGAEAKSMSVGAQGPSVVEVLPWRRTIQEPPRKARQHQSCGACLQQGEQLLSPEPCPGASQGSYGGIEHPGGKFKYAGRGSHPVFMPPLMHLWDEVNNISVCL